MMSEAKIEARMTDYQHALWAEARDAYEAATQELRRVTAAAWVRWDDLDLEAQAHWVEVVHYSRKAS